MVLRSVVSLSIAVSLLVAACGGSSTPPPASGASPAPTSTPGGSTSGGGGGIASPAGSGAAASDAGSGSGGSGTVAGSIVSSGAYSATWTWRSPNAVNPGEVVLTSDKNTFGDLQVGSDGSITFTTGAPEVSAGSPFLGTGGTQTTKQVSGLPTVCGIAVDDDVTGTNGTTLHLKGSLTISGTVTGDVGDITC
jgi:hypothetical protein